MHFDPGFKTSGHYVYAVYWKSEETASFINHQKNLNYLCNLTDF